MLKNVQFKQTNNEIKTKNNKAYTIWNIYYFLLGPDTKLNNKYNFNIHFLKTVHF